MYVYITRTLSVYESIKQYLHKYKLKRVKKNLNILVHNLSTYLV